MFLQLSKLSFARLFILALLFQQFNVGSEACGAILPGCLNDAAFTATVDSPGILSPDTIRIDSIRPDSLSNDSATGDTAVADDVLKSEIKYTARDSMPVDIENEVTYLYGNATVDYEDLHLNADYIMIDMQNKELFATGLKDSSGNTTGLPEFSQGTQKFKSHTIRYNFNSKKGKIGYVITQQGEGYIHGEVVKKDQENNFFIRKGQYTTCDLDTPHFAITSNKLKVINNNKIVTGPAYMTIEGVPTPIIIPFGFFPSKQGRSSGLIFPAFGESNERGFYFQGLGYYFGFSDYVTLALKTDLYTKGSYGLNATTMYKKRYKYSGALDLSYAYTVQGEKELPDYQQVKDFHVNWRHTQDPKVNPYSNFSASVNAGTANYYYNTISSIPNFQQNTLASSINFSHSFPETPINMGISASHSQNILTRDIQINLPDISVNVSRIYPFKRRLQIGKQLWYEKIGLTYSFRSTNYIQTKDTLLFQKGTLDNLQNGIMHTIPLSTSFNILSYFNLTPGINYTERWYYKTIRQRWNVDSNRVETIFVNGFEAARNYDLTASISTIIYGKYQFRRGKITAIRHVIKPVATFAYRPDYSDPKYGYYKTFLDENNVVHTYSIFDNTIYKGPGAGEVGALNFSLDNNLEMKVKTNSDTGATEKKIKIFESLSINGSYNFMADSMKLGQIINLNARSTLFNRISLSFNSTFNPYEYDLITQSYYDKFLIENGGPLVKMTSVGISMSFSLNKQSKPVNYTPQELAYFDQHPENYVDFDIPYNLSVGYNYHYSINPGRPSTYSQTASFNGDLALTPKWKIGYTSSYDFVAGQISSLGLDLHRDLHCWEMHMNWIPYGHQESWTFQINVKASILKDLKLNKQKQFYD